MAHKRKDTLAAVRSWAKHLRKFAKRIHAKSERRAVQIGLQKGKD